MTARLTDEDLRAIRATFEAWVHGRPMEATGSLLDALEAERTEVARLKSLFRDLIGDRCTTPWDGVPCDCAGDGSDWGCNGYVCTFCGVSEDDTHADTCTWLMVRTALGEPVDVDAKGKPLDGGAS
jgi:hypothetical protein